MYILCRWLFAIVVAYPVVFIWLGLTVRHHQRLPKEGPAIIVANHNSHLDTLVLLAMLPFLRIPRIRPVAAADYFTSNRITSFLSHHFLGIIPVNRATPGTTFDDPLAGISKALDAGEIVLLFPEGTRGNPEELSHLKPGLWHLMRRYPHVQVTPVYLHGLGRSLPKGTFIPVPFFIDAYVGNTLLFHKNRKVFIDEARHRFEIMRTKTIATLPETLLEKQNHE